ncbi:hypothetical protein H072_2149 [Dactylellina haptotyla CBS 200.50]|uniref:AB hydrolase-1 domain-containing protein n=1 Tax=Dactylellina haptotyla (strain CBS 200.50) TaxID=1284197 RepID=S8BWT5_DACHA|nr:hypothetical protein H072_2149 [Dactylellina haptotyla CBS 200.50]
MVSFNPTLKGAYWSLVGVGGLYIGFLALLLIPVVQKNFFYLHNVRLPIWPDITRPEQLGFAGNEVTPFYLTTPDNERLFAWHILPQGVYAKHRDELLRRDVGLVSDITQTLGFRLLKEDKEARLIVFFHGNAGNLAQGYRPDAYRTWAGADSSRIHILAFDYRGFGRSTGDPSEEGLITDAITALNFAMHTVGIDPSRILVLGHSLGTAVTLGATERLAREQGIEFAGVILCAAFAKLKTLILTYSIGGVIPILSPLRPYPIVQKWLMMFVREPWDGEERLKSLIQHSPHLKLTMLHAHNDYEISSTQSLVLFHTAANAIMAAAKNGQSATEGELASPLEFEEVEKRKQRLELGDEGWIDTWVEGVPPGGWKIEHRMVKWGAHDQVITGSTIKLVIREMFGL